MADNYGYDPSRYIKDFSWIGNIGQDVAQFAHQVPELLQLNKQIKENNKFKDMSYSATNKFIDNMDDNVATNVVASMHLDVSSPDEAKQKLREMVPKFNNDTKHEDYAGQLVNNFYAPVYNAAKSNLGGGSLSFGDLITSDKEAKKKITQDQLRKLWQGAPTETQPGLNQTNIGKSIQGSIENDQQEQQKLDNEEKQRQQTNKIQQPVNDVVNRFLQNPDVLDPSNYGKTLRGLNSALKAGVPNLTPDQMQYGLQVFHSAYDKAIQSSNAANNEVHSKNQEAHNKVEENQGQQRINLESQRLSFDQKQSQDKIDAGPKAPDLEKVNKDAQVANQSYMTAYKNSKVTQGKNESQEDFQQRKRDAQAQLDDAQKETLARRRTAELYANMPKTMENYSKALQASQAYANTSYLNEKLPGAMKWVRDVNSGKEKHGKVGGSSNDSKFNAMTKLNQEGYGEYFHYNPENKKIEMSPEYGKWQQSLDGVGSLPNPKQTMDETLNSTRAPTADEVEKSKQILSDPQSPTDIKQKAKWVVDNYGNN